MTILMGREHRHAMSAGCLDGSLVRPVTGVTIPTARASDPLWLLAAACLRDPGAVVVGAAAAWLTWWPDRTPDRLVLANSRLTVRLPALVATRTVVREAFVRERTAAVGGRTVPMRVATNAWSALDLWAETDRASVYRALREGRVTTAQLHEVVAARRGEPGIPALRAFMNETRDGPWSEAERLAHVLLRAAGIRGWRANAAVRCGNRTYYVDLLFDGFVVELDGFEFHSSKRAFEADRARSNALLAAGLPVLRFTWEVLTTAPETFVAQVRAMQARRT